MRNVLGKRNPDLYNVTFSKNLTPWIYTGRRVGRPTDIWAIKALEKMWQEIKKVKREYEYTDLDTNREDIREAIFKYAEEIERKEDKKKGRQREEEEREKENEEEEEERISSDRPSGSASSLFQKDQELVGRLVGTLSQKVQDPPYSHRGEDAEASIRPGATWSQSKETDTEGSKEEEDERKYDASYEFWKDFMDWEDEEENTEKKKEEEEEEERKKGKEKEKKTLR